MRLVLIAGFFGMSLALGIVRPAALWDTYRQLYPADSAERRALNECFTQDPKFNRLDATEREACYRHNAPALASFAGVPSSMPRPVAPNFVDLWRSAGQGRMPQNDIRAEQQNDRFFHPVAEGRMP